MKNTLKLLFIALLCCSATYAQNPGPSPDWVRIAADEYGYAVFSYSPDSVTRTAPNTYKLWGEGRFTTKVVKQEKVFGIYVVEIRCVERQLRIASLRNYPKNGKLIERDKNVAFEQAIPGTPEDNLLNTVCKQDR